MPNFLTLIQKLTKLVFELASSFVYLQLPFMNAVQEP